MELWNVGAAWPQDKRVSMLFSRARVYALCLALGLFCLPGLAGTAGAAPQNITYIGDGAGLQALPGTVHGGAANSLFPGTAAAPEGTNNLISINDSGGATPASYVLGGLSLSGAVNGNQVNVNGGSVSQKIYGGYSLNGNVTNNIVIVNLGNIGGTVVAGEADNGSLIANRVFINGGTINSIVYGAQGSVTDPVQNNSVTITGGTLTGTGVRGAAAFGDVSGNSVTISGGSFGLNTIIEGGYSNMLGSATGNSVIISGGTFQNAIYGGFVETGTGSATGNTVTISGAPTLTASTLFGGGTTSSTGDLRSGNTLNVQNSGMSAKGIANFANYNFHLPTGMTAGQTMLTVSDGNGAGGAADISNSIIGVGVNGGTSALNVGDQVTLISSGTGLTATGINTRAQGLQGIAKLYDFDLSFDANNLFATVLALPGGGAYSLNPQLKSLSEGRLAGLAFVNQGADLIVGPGMYSALLATQRQGNGFAPFASMSGGSSRYDTGSHINVDGFSMMTGLAWRAPLEPQTGSFLAGAFFEAGWGNYDSHNSFSSAPSVKGDGDTSYYGGGVLTRYEMPAGPGGIYGEASFRVGHVSTDFSSDDIMGSGGHADYDSGSAYYGAHAGLGYVWNVNDKAALDFSTKYIWTHQNSDSVTIQGDRINFKAADSQRWRTGARFSYAVNEMFTPYAGAYYDHEFDGRAKASTAGLSIDAPDLTGGTGVGELGLTFKPAKDSGFSVDLGMQGYTGVREGVSGSAQLKFEF